MAKLKLPFELEKPSANEYVTQSSQIGHNGQPLDDVLEGLDNISKQSTQSEEQALVFETDGGVQVGKIDANGADFANLKCGGQQVARMSDLPIKDSSIGDSPSTTNVPTTKAVKDYVDAHSGGDYPIDTETTSSEDEEQVWENNAETQEYAKIGSYGIKSKAYLDMQGQSIIDGEIGNTPSTTHAPSAKAVKDYVDEHGGGGDFPINKETASGADDKIIFTTEDNEIIFSADGNGVCAKDFKTLGGKSINKYYSINVNKLVHSDFLDMTALDTNHVGYSDFLDYFYALYDTLLSSYPSFVAKQNLDTLSSIPNAPYDVTTYPIYGYDFKFTGNSYSANNQELVKILIVTGTHPLERVSIFAVYKLMEVICHRWDIEDIAELRQGVEFYVIPCSCPWGVVNNRSNNINNVNLNRNCGTTDWVYNAEQQTGPSADSEYETKVFEWQFNRFKPQIFFDLHTFNAQENPGGVEGCIFRPLGVSNDWAKATISVLKQETLRVMKKYSDVVQNPDLYLGDIEKYPTSAGGGQRAYWSYQHGVEFSTNTEVRPVFGWKNGTVDYSDVVVGDAKIVSIFVDTYINLIYKAIDFVINKKQ